MNRDVISVRKRLYESSGLESRVLHNPIDSGLVVENSTILDLTYDTVGHTRIYHENLTEARGYVSKAGIVVTDNSQLMRVAKIFNRSVLSLPFGYSNVRKVGGDFTVGIMNIDDDDKMHNTWFRKVITSIGNSYKLLVCGEPIKDHEVAVDFDDFASRVDVLLLPAIPRVLVSTTLPLSAMMAGCVVLATGGYSVLSACPGVIVLDNIAPLAWKRHVEMLSQQPRKLNSLRERSVSYAKAVSRQSMEVVRNIASKG